MGNALIIVRIMPESPGVNLKLIKDNIEKLVLSEGAQGIKLEEQEIAFGLKAIVLKMAFPEEKGTEILERELSKIDNVSSVTIEDYRRAL